MISKIKNWFKKRKMIKEMEQKNVFKQVEECGLNKEEILFIYDLIAKDSEFLKDQINHGESIKVIIDGLGKMSNADQIIDEKMQEYITKTNEQLEKLQKSKVITDSIVKKLQPLKEIFE